MRLKTKRNYGPEGIDVRYTCGRVLWVRRDTASHLEPSASDGVLRSNHPCAACRMGLKPDAEHPTKP